VEPEAFHAAVEGAEASDASRIVIDLRALDFIDSTGLREVLIAGRRSEVNGDRLRARAGKSELRRLLELTAIDQTLPLIDYRGAHSS
jgi:anti-anti-sigma factor